MYLPFLTKFNAAVVVDLLVFSYIKGVTCVSWMLYSLFMTMHVLTFHYIKHLCYFVTHRIINNVHQVIIVNSYSSRTRQI